MNRSTLLLLGVVTSGLAACQSPPVAPLGQAATQGSVSVVALDATQRFLVLEGPSGARVTASPHYVVRIQLQNNGTTPVNYDLGWAAAAGTQANSPLLFTAPAEGQPMTSGQHIPTTMLSTYRWLEDPVTSPQSVPPGGTLEDLLVFDAPPAGPLVLSLPPTVFAADAQMPAYITLPAATDPQPALESVSIGEVATLPGVQVAVTGVENAWAPLQGDAGAAGYSDAPLVHVRFRITNQGTTTKEFVPVEANRSLDAPTLVTDDGTAVGRAEFAVRVTPRERATTRQAIGPGETYEGVLLFERPAPTTTALSLRVPGVRLGTTGLASFTLPYTHTEPPQPADLTPRVIDAPATP
jgi:hypothetical protein